MMIDETTLYYTFSTISQTLGGTIALLGAFVLYKIQTIYTHLDQEINEIIRLFEGKPSRIIEKIKHLILFKDYEKIVEALKKDLRIQVENKVKTMKPDNVYEVITDKNEIRYNQVALSVIILWENKKDIFQQMKYSLIVSILTIILSVIILSCTPLICDLIKIYIILLGIGLFSACIILYGIIISKAIKL